MITSVLLYIIGAIFIAFIWWVEMTFISRGFGFHVGYALLGYVVYGLGNFVFGTLSWADLVCRPMGIAIVAYSIFKDYVKFG